MISTPEYATALDRPLGSSELDHQAIKKGFSNLNFQPRPRKIQGAFCLTIYPEAVGRLFSSAADRVRSPKGETLGGPVAEVEPGVKMLYLVSGSPEQKRPPLCAVRGRGQQVSRFFFLSRTTYKSRREVGRRPPPFSFFWRSASNHSISPISLARVVCNPGPQLR